ncbi:hypothetical protein BM221_010133 [Beauveria bassiana]|uniref:Uncharacterized protein n=1 Tax=Beauveria bassiana TaxID=176275 RepID=A0A2N6N9P1_BEABA|nr:hypothetical protein BM221_010133 [Beauveria bassiana]
MTEHNAVASTTKSKETSDNSPDGTTPKNSPIFERGPRFWAIIVVLAIISLVTTLEGTVTSTIMPSVVDDLGGGELFIWVSNAYFLTM